MLALGLPFLAYGLIYNLLFCILGVTLIVAGIYGWIMEPSTEPGGHDEHDDPHPSDASGDAVATTEEAALVD